MKRIFLSLLWCACTFGMHEPLTPCMEKALLAMQHEKKIKAWRYFREEQVPVHQGVHAIQHDGVIQDNVMLFECIPTHCIHRSRFALNTSHFTFHDSRFSSEYDVKIKTYKMTHNNGLVWCDEKINPESRLVKEACVFVPGQSSHDSLNNMSVMFTCDLKDLTITNFVLFYEGKALCVLKQNMRYELPIIADVIIRNNVVMMVTKFGNVTRFSPYDPTCFELQTEKITRGWDTFFRFR